MRAAAQSTNKAQRTLGLLLYLFGLLATLALGCVAIWGDLEASLFDVSIQAQEGLPSLRCPVLMSRRETGQISATFENSGQRPIERPIRAHISDGFITLIREENVRLPLQPGERQRWTWEVSADDAAYGYLILARISTLRQSPMPSQSGACGILVIDIPWVNGQTITALWLLVGLASLLGGGWLRQRTATRRAGWQPATAAIVALSLVVIAILIVGLMGQWIAGVLLLALFVLLLLTIVAQLISEN